MMKVECSKRETPPGVIFFVVCCLLAIAKIIIVSHEEILARDLPHDDLWHILAAARGYWFGGNYSNMSFVHLPVYSLWVAIVYFTGVPLRIATELFFLVSGFLFVISLSRADVNKAVCTVAYGLIIFHPVSFQLFNYNLAETLYASLCLLELAALIMTWLNRGNKVFPVYAICSGVIASLLWNLRKENLLILGLILFWGGIAGIAFRKEGFNWRCILHQIGIMTLLPLLIVVASTFIIKAINYKKIGLFVSTEMSAPGYTAAYKSLLRIKPQHPIRFIPVTKEVRRVAYSVSPAFRELEPFLERESGFGMFETEKYMGIKGEIAAGWFYWVLRDAAASAGHHTTAIKADAYYQQIADEVNAAIDSGRLPGRHVFLTFLDPEIKNYLPYLPDSLLKMWRLFTSSAQPPRGQETADLNPAVRKAFDIVTNRRTALTRVSGCDDVILQGWVFNQDAEPIRQVLLKSATGVTLGICQSLTPRTDVAKSYVGLHGVNIPAKTGFTVIAAQAESQLDDAKLVFISGAKREIIVPYKDVVIGKVIQLQQSNTAYGITYAIDSSSASKVPAFRDVIQRFIWAIYGKLVAAFTCIGIASLMIILLLYRSIDFKENIYPIMLLLLFTVLTRVFLFALLDSSSWPGDQSRYLFPVMPEYSCFLLLLIVHTVSIIKIKVKMKLIDNA